MENYCPISRRYNISKNIGINYLHKNNIVHRDIKPANIFRSNNMFKLGDMNVSKVMPIGSLAKTQIGSPLYTSP